MQTFEEIITTIMEEKGFSREKAVNEYLEFFCWNMPNGKNRELAEYWNHNKTFKEEYMKYEFKALCLRNSSELKLNQTSAEFFKIIDKKIIETNLSTNEIKKLNNDIKHACNKEEKMYFRTLLNDYCCQVYEKLKEMGYNHYDLVG